MGWFGRFVPQRFKGPQAEGSDASDSDAITPNEDNRRPTGYDNC